MHLTCADPENFLGGGGGGGEGVQIPRRGLTENVNMTKINNLAIPGGNWICPCLNAKPFALFTYMSLCTRKPSIWAPTKSDKNRAVQSQKKISEE